MALTMNWLKRSDLLDFLESHLLHADGGLTSSSHGLVLSTGSCTGCTGTVCGDSSSCQLWGWVTARLLHRLYCASLSKRSSGLSARTRL